MSPMFYRNFRFNTLYRGSAQLIAGVSLILLSHPIAPSTWINKSLTDEIRVAQAQFTVDQLPDSEQQSNSPTLNYGDRVNGALNVSSVRHQGRRFDIYRFEGEQEQLIRISLVGGSADTRSPDQLQTGSLLINPAVILLDPNGTIINQQPEQAEVANALIRMNLPMTGTYTILVTSATVGGGGRYTLTLQHLDQEI